MSISSIWPFFACMAVLMAFSATPLFQPADSPPSPRPGRISTLDGLRGFLALSVVFQHMALYQGILLNGEWPVFPSRFYMLLGHFGVEMFFMITGYLFWARLIKERGRPDWLRLYTGRIFRIGPIYLLAVSVMLMIVFSRTGLHLNVPVAELMRQLGRWLMLGLRSVQGVDVNGYAGTRNILLNVTWTLQLEWLFYLSLPLTALAARLTWTHLPLAAAGLAGCLAYIVWSNQPPGASTVLCASLFFTGMTCASLEKLGLTARVPGWLASTSVLFLIILIFATFSNIYAAVPVVLIGLAFYLIISGCSVFGLLTNRAARRLGNVSYGIYLLQGLVLTLVFSFGPARAFALASPPQYWTMELLCAALLVAVATVAHVAVERTGVELGKRAGSALGTTRDRLKAAALSIIPR